jgi:soluble lytic murein transglycosylase-like protein
MKPPEPPRQPAERMRSAVADLVKDIKEQRAQTAAELRAERERAARRAKRIYRWVVLASLAFAGSLIYAVPRMSTPWAPPAGEEALRDARATLEFGSRLIEAFRAQHGRLPDSLDELGVAVQGMSYRKGRTGWELSVELPDRAPLVLGSDGFRP